jgi:hypothetical protein
MRLRTSRWILRFILLPLLLLMIAGPFLANLFGIRMSDNLIVYLILVALGAAIPLLIIYVIWKGQRDSDRISDRRRRRRQASREKAKRQTENPFTDTPPEAIEN